MIQENTYNLAKIDELKREIIPEDNLILKTDDSENTHERSSFTKTRLLKIMLVKWIGETVKPREIDEK